MSTDQTLDTRDLRSLDHHTRAENGVERVRFLTMCLQGDLVVPLCVVSLTVDRGIYSVSTSSACPDAGMVLPFARAWSRCAAFIKTNNLVTPESTDAGVEIDALHAEIHALRGRLREHCNEVSRSDLISTYSIASDRTLREIATLRPCDLTQLQRAYGIGPAKAARYGAGLLAVVQSTPESE